MNPGYIYILQNPSLSEFHLKIGRTERDPNARAAEISSATGVPTPFEVVWWSESVDCHLAETLLHRQLDQYRTNTTREFFELELDEAIRIARRAIARSGGRTGGIVYYLRSAALWVFHCLIRPLLRLPLQVLLLAGLVVFLLVKGVFLLGWGITRGAFAVFATLLTSSGKKGKRRKRKSSKSVRTRRRTGPALLGNPWYLKEVGGAILWVLMLYFLVAGGGVIHFNEVLSNSFLSRLIYFE
ncbi:MAG: GIY-YIG nuclease family protein [Verrucomicrobiales bacterium]|nr:GIY-YIG nuclease family protein [Verrucomicrobiales bacterium]